MSIFRTLFRGSRRALLLKANPFQVLVASVRQNAGDVTVIERTAEFPATGSDAALNAWLDEQFGANRAPLPVYGSFTPSTVIIRRESLQPRRLAEPEYLNQLLLERNRLHQPEDWHLAALDPFDGSRLSTEGSPRPGLFFGIPQADVQQFQQRLLDCRLLPQRIECGPLSVFGAVSDYVTRHDERRATVIVVIEQEHTTAYILGKEGLHTPAVVAHGFTSIVRAIRREFGFEEDEEVRREMHEPAESLLLRAGKFVRAIGRDLKPLIDSYEMSTGQPVGGIYCAHLPASLSWLTEPLAQVMQRSVLRFDCTEWMPAVGLQAGPELPVLGAQWCGALSLVAQTTADPSQPAPWRLDCRFSADSTDLAPGRRRVAAPLLAGLAAALALGFAAWQAYLIRSLEEDTAYWEQQMAAQARLFAELTRSTQALKLQSARFDHAYALARPAHPVTELILDLGRSLPANMQVDRLEANPGRVAMSGHLREPPEQSSRTLGRYMEEMRQSPAIGPLFTNIDLTSLQRDGDTDDSVLFEITFTLPSTPAP